MEFFTPILPEAVSSLGIALVVSSNTPLMLLANDLTVVAVSASFCAEFELDAANIVGSDLLAMGIGEWNKPQLRSLLKATASGDAAIDAYEMDLIRDGRENCCLILSAHLLEYGAADERQIVLAVADVTAARLAERVKDDLVREKHVLLQELQHRVANSLQIIASVLMQSARRTQSDEARTHLRDAHHRIMSVATLQKQLASVGPGEVELRSYFADLCNSIGASMIADPGRIALTTACDGSVTTAETSVSLGLIVTELVINALKHAFPGRTQQGRITVDYTSHGKHWALRVSDNGNGMPVDHTTMKPGLGTAIVDALSRQLHATVNVGAANPGTLVSIISDARPGLTAL